MTPNRQHDPPRMPAVPIRVVPPIRDYARRAEPAPTIDIAQDFPHPPHMWVQGCGVIVHIFDSGGNIRHLGQMNTAPSFRHRGEIQVDFIIGGGDRACPDFKFIPLGGQHIIAFFEGEWGTVGILVRPPGALGGAGLELVEYVPDGAVEKRSSGGAKNPGPGGDMKFRAVRHGE